MTNKVFVTDDKIATFVCPECGNTRTADVSEYKQLDKAVRLRIQCSCGNSYSAVLERRDKYRKEAKFPGKYTLNLSGKEVDEGAMTVVNISRAGLRIEFKEMPNFEVGTKLLVEFRLDDKQDTLIKKDVIVKNISGHSVGTEFCSISSSDPKDKALGFYLL